MQSVEKRIKAIEQAVKETKPKGEGFLVVYRDSENPDLYHHRPSGETLTRQDLDDLGEQYEFTIIVQYIDSGGKHEID